MRALTDLQVLALLCAAPVDERAESDLDGTTRKVAAGHLAPWERKQTRALLDLLDQGEDNRAFALSVLASHGASWRLVLARVFGLPERDGSGPLVMSLAWAKNDEPTEAAS